MDNEPEIISPRTQQTLPLSWSEGFKMYLHDPHAKVMLRRFAIKFLPIAGIITILDDFLIPGIGFIDNVTWPFIFGGIVVMLFKVNRYRHHPIRVN